MGTSEGALDGMLVGSFVGVADGTKVANLTAPPLADKSEPMTVQRTEHLWELL